MLILSGGTGGLIVFSFNFLFFFFFVFLGVLVGRGHLICKWS